MDNKSSMSRVERLHREKVTRYSIRKYSFGAASVAVAALFMFLGNGAVSANELSKQETSVEAPAPAHDSPSTPTESTPAAQPGVGEPTAKPAESTPAAQPIAEESTQPAAPEVTTPALDKTKLENYISEVKSKLSAGKYANKTEESLALLNGELASAESTLASATTQDELTKAYQKLVTFVSSGLKNKPKEAPKVDTTNGQPTVGKKAENTEPKSNSIENTGSHDSRNGNALDKDNAFRAETADTEKPKVSIDYDDAASKTFWITPTEETNITGRIKITDNSGKIVKGWMQKMGGGKDINVGYGLNNSNIDGETTATAAQPATLSVTGKLQARHPNGNPWANGGTIVSRKVRAKDASNNEIDNEGASDPDYQVFFKVRSQNVKYTEDLANKAANFAKVAVADPAQLQQPELDKIKAELQAGDGNNLNGKIDTVTQKGDKVVITYNDGTTAERPVTDFTRINQAPTAEIPFSDPAPDKKEIFVYGGEENSFDIKIKDDSGKIVSATVRQGSNRPFNEVPGETNKINTQYGYTANTITAETPATEANPAVITYKGTPAPEGTFTQDKLEAATKGEAQGTPLGWRYLRVADADGGEIGGNATSASDIGAFRVMLKPQTQKYDIQEVAQADKVAVSDANNVTDAEFDKIKEKVKLEYSKTNPDKNLESKRGEEVTDKTAKIDTITKDGNNLVVTYKDGSIDKKPLTDFARTNEAPTFDIPFSNKEEKQIYLYTTEENDISLKVKDDSGKVKEAVLKFPGSGDNESYMTGGNKDGMYLKKEGVTTSEVTASEDAPHEIKVTGAIPKGAWGLNSNTGMTRILYAKDTDDKDTTASFANNKSVNGYIRFVLKDQTTKYDIKTLDAENKIAVNDANDLTDADLEKIKNNLKV